MQVKGKHDRPLYFTVHRIIRNKPHSGRSRVCIEHYASPGHATFKDSYPPVERHPDDHLLVQCQWYPSNGEDQAQMPDRGPKVGSDVLRIDVDTSYNLLLGRPWIHRNSIVPSTLHQVMKYIDGSEKVRTLIAKRHPFKGVENYFTDSLLYGTL